MRKGAMFTAGLFAMVATVLTGPARADDLGILLLAHGASDMGMAHMDMPGMNKSGPAKPRTWEDNVETLSRDLNRRRPTEIAFGMAEPESMQAAIDRLEKRGVHRIVAVPLFISSHSPIIDNFRYILGLREKLAANTQIDHLDRIHSKAGFSFTAAMDGDPIISEILVERAAALSKDPAKTDVVLIAHGPNDDEENRAWLRDMDSHAAYMRDHGKFRSVTVLTHRNDAEAPVKGAARTDFRKAVEDSNRTGGETVVVPLLLSEGGIEAEVQGDLKGLSFKFAKPLMPHPNIAKWVESQVKSVATGG